MRKLPRVVLWYTVCAGIASSILACSKANDAPGKANPGDSMTAKDLQAVMETIGISYTPDVNSSHVALFYDKTNSKICLRLTIPKMSTNELQDDEWRSQHVVSSSDFKADHFNIADVYSLRWWDALPWKEDDAHLAWVLNGARAWAICRPGETTDEYYIVFLSLSRDINPRVISFLRNGSPVKTARSPIPARTQAYEMQYTVGGLKPGVNEGQSPI